MPTVVSPEDYFPAALRLLHDHGAAGIRVGTLCSSLGVTTGSFYNYFGGLDRFIVQLMEHVEGEITDRIIQLSHVPDDPIERMNVMKGLAVTLNHEAEAAIRAWASSNPAVAEVQRRIDETRFAALFEIVRSVVPDRRTAELLSITGITLLVGCQQWRSPVDVDELGRLLDEYQASILAHLPPSDPVSTAPTTSAAADTAPRPRPASSARRWCSSS